jgi:hypothetical protein
MGCLVSGARPTDGERERRAEAWIKAVVVTYTAALFLISVVSVGAAFKKFKLHLG